MKYTELKQYLKDSAVEIRAMKGQRKGVRYGYVSGLDDLRYKVRHHHIAYCLLRGTEMEDIEGKTREDNAPSRAYVNQIMDSIEPREELAA